MELAGARVEGWVTFFLRNALGVSFLSAVGDRLGMFGGFGQPNVAWGDFARFVQYTGKLNWFLPESVIPALAVIATVAESAMGLLLVIGWQTRWAALLSGLLLLSFALTMTIAVGVRAPLNFSVFTAAGAAFLLSTRSSFPFSVDEAASRSTRAV